MNSELISDVIAFMELHIHWIILVLLAASIGLYIMARKRTQQKVLQRARRIGVLAPYHFYSVVLSTRRLPRISMSPWEAMTMLDEVERCVLARFRGEPLPPVKDTLGRHVFSYHVS